jgi:hypothetical protein
MYKVILGKVSPYTKRCFPLKALRKIVKNMLSCVNPLLRYEFATDPFYITLYFYSVYVPHIAGRGPLRKGPVRRCSERPRVGRGAGNRAAGIP